jgi:hypothetical protein
MSVPSQAWERMSSMMVHCFRAMCNKDCSLYIYVCMYACMCVGMYLSLPRLGIGDRRNVIYDGKLFKNDV